MKIMHINCLDHGSTGKMIMEISKAADEKGWESVICVPKKNLDTGIKTYATSFSHEQGLYLRCCYYLGRLKFGFAPVSTHKILNAIRQEKPDVVHLHSINCNMVNIYRLVEYLKVHDIATVVTNHAEFFYTGSCDHAGTCTQWINGCRKCENVFSATFSKTVDRSSTAWKKMHDAFSGFKRIQIVSVSPWGMNRSASSGILGALPNMTIKNGLDCATFHPVDGEYVREKYHIPHQGKIILHVTAKFSDTAGHPKGGPYVLEMAKRFPEVVFVVAGEGHITKELPPNVYYIGKVMNQDELAALYSVADLSLLTSVRETFSMVVAESLCCGTPTVGFFAGGPETIAIPQYSEFVEYGNCEELERIIRKWIGFKNKEISQSIASCASEEYSSEKMAKSYLDVYERLTKL